VALLPALVAACQSYVFEPVVPSLISVNNTTYELDDVVSADILFVIDDSGSMAGEQSNLSANFDVFINAIQSENDLRKSEGKPLISYQIAVASSSISLNFENFGGVRTSYAAGSNCQTPYPIVAGTAYPAGKFMAAPGNPEVLSSDELNSGEIITKFKQNVQLGVCGSGQEQGLLGARLALEAHPEFVRPNSKLVVVFLSDEEDCSDPNMDLVLQSGVDRCVEEAAAPNGGLLGPVSDYADFLKKLSKNLTVGAIVSATGSGPDIQPGVCRDLSCEASCSSGSDPRGDPCYCGGMAPGSRYLQLADLVSGSIKDSICQSSFSETLNRLAQVIVSVKEIRLSSRPVNDNPKLMLLKIVRDGQDILCGSPSASLQSDSTQSCSAGNLDWEYDANEVMIRLCDRPGSQCNIQPGDRYKVSFVEGACSLDHPC